MSLKIRIEEFHFIFTLRYDKFQYAFKICGYCVKLANVEI